MGMDYTYAGSASYPRFNNEIKGIVELFGGRMISDRKPPEACTMVEYFMEKPLKYEMPEGTPKTFIDWVNNPYEWFSNKKVKEIYEFLKPKIAEVKEISDQIVYELESIIECGDSWQIY